MNKKTTEMLDGKVPMHKDIKRLMMINSLYNFFFGLAEPFIVIFFNEFGSIEEVGISVALLLIMQGLVSLFVSKLISRIGAKKIILTTQILESSRIIALILAPNVHFIYLLQVIGGILRGFNEPSYDNLFVNVCKDESSSSIGIYSSFTIISYGASALIGGLIIGAFGYAPVFILWAAQELIYGVYLYLKL